jgi:CheY-like chemotaxis protein
VVDDNSQAREILSDALRGFTLRADTASSGEEAIQKLAASDATDPYGLVMMDWRMPGMDGLEASRIIKLGGRLENIPRIVMVTAFGREEIRAQAEELGVDGFLSKPVSASVLYDTLMDLFGAGQADAAGVRREEAMTYDARGIRILLVEDNEMNQQVARELLESAEAEVTIANNGAEAVRMLKEGAQTPMFDVVLMDVQMPEMDGYTATKVLRADPRFREIPILAMTAHALVEEKQRCLQAGMNDHLTKPIEPEALFATLKRWVKPHQMDGARPLANSVARDEAGFPEMEGIDTAGGLKRVAGNKRLYRSLLEQFAAKQPDAGVRIAAALRGEDEALAERIAHTVKGVAGNLGITAVQSAAENVERRIRDGGGSEAGLIQELEGALGHAVHTIRRQLAHTPSAPQRTANSGAFDLDAASAALARLRGLIEANDGEAVDAFPAVECALARIADRPQIEALQSALEDFDFAGALSKLEEITQRKL